MNTNKVIFIVDDLNSPQQTLQLARETVAKGASVGLVFRYPVQKDNAIVLPEGFSGKSKGFETLEELSKLLKHVQPQKVVVDLQHNSPVPAMALEVISTMEGCQVWCVSDQVGDAAFVPEKFRSVVHGMFVMDSIESLSLRNYWSGLETVKIGNIHYTDKTIQRLHHTKILVVTQGQEVSTALLRKLHEFLKEGDSMDRTYTIYVVQDPAYQAGDVTQELNALASLSHVRIDARPSVSVSQIRANIMISGYSDLLLYALQYDMVPVSLNTPVIEAAIRGKFHDGSYPYARFREAFCIQINAIDGWFRLMSDNRYRDQLPELYRRYVQYQQDARWRPRHAVNELLK